MGYAPSPLRVDAVWDIETANWDEFVVGAIWTPDEGVVVHHAEDTLAEHLLGLPRGAVAWAHNGGKFDVLWLLDWCRRNLRIPEAQIRMSGSSVASLAIKGGPVLRDSARLMPMSLAQATTMFAGARKERLELPCVCDRACGGYCSIRVTMSARDRARLVEYLTADVISLRDTLTELSAYAQNNALLLGGTVASTGWRTAKERCGLPDAEWDLEAYALAREAYFGGLVAVGRTRARKVHRFDRRQAYPAELCKPVPCGDMRMLTPATAGRAWRAHKPGVYSASVFMPEMLAPPLPLRAQGRIVYPHGRFEGVWVRDELAHAVDCGAKILKMTGGLVWKDEKPLLREHVTHCFALREATDNKALKTWLKFVANSLTGAFAQDPVQDIVALGDYADDPRWEPVGKYDWIWRRESFRISQRGHVHWAGTLTGGARVELNRQIQHVGDGWCYSDTDSNYSLQEQTRNVGNGLGQWVSEGIARNYVALAPKVYTYETPDGRHARAKGIPDAVSNWDRIVAGDPEDPVKLDRGVDSLLVASRGESLFQRRDGHRTVAPREGWCGARIVDGVRTRAPSVSELLDIPK